MLNLQDELIISNNGQGMYEITNNVHDWIVKNNIIKGQLNLFIRHTSASLTIMENASPDVLDDINSFFQRIVPEDASLYKHCLLYTSPSPRDKRQSRMPSSA